MPSPPLPIYALAALFLTALLLAGCGGTSNSNLTATLSPMPSVDTPTITPLGSPSVTVTVTPSSVVLADVPEVKEARQSLKDGNYDRAVQLLRRVTARYPESSAAQAELADAYQQWGSNLVSTSKGAIAQLSIALEKFTSGLAVIPADSSAQPALQSAYNEARAYVDAAVAQDALNGTSASMQSAARRAEAERILKLFAVLYDRNPTFPGLAQRYVLALVAAGTSYLEGGTTPDEQISFREQALAYCTQAQKLDPQLSTATTCVNKAKQAVAPPTVLPTPVPPPPAKPAHLVIKLKDRNERPGCISVQVRNTSAAGWSLTIDGMNLSAQFDGGNNSSLCGLPDHAITFTIRNGAGSPVRGGSSPAAGRDILLATWVR